MVANPGKPTEWHKAVFRLWLQDLRCTKQYLDTDCRILSGISQQSVTGCFELPEAIFKHWLQDFEWQKTVFTH